jgi:preprotein translocase subunit YajC
MKLIDALILSLSLALIIVGIHQTLVNGIGSAYAIFMVAVALLFWFQLRRNQKQDSQIETPKKSMKPKKRS